MSEEHLDPIENATIPNDIDHIRFIEYAASVTSTNTAGHLSSYSDELSLLGVSLNALYQAGTCHRNCHGGAHVLEALCGRAYNLACSAFFLCQRGFYDEGLNLVRSIGEVANLIALSIEDGSAIQEWMRADKKTRLKEFSPAKVRQRLKSSLLLIADADWYSDLCEEFTHVTPQTRPNCHDNRAHVGGILQSDGLRKTIDELVTVTSAVAMMICRYFDYPDLSSDLIARVRRTCGAREDGAPR